MAKNLRAKLPESDTLVIFDQNPDVLTKFQTEVGIAATGAGASAKGTGITIAESSRDAAEKSVRNLHASKGPFVLLSFCDEFCSIYDLSWELCLFKCSFCDFTTLILKPIL